MAFLKLKETFFVFSLVITLAQLKPSPAPRYNKNGQVVFLGDSITDSFDNDGIETWNQYYVPLGAVNTGVGGWTTQNIIDGINGGMIDNLNAYQAVLKIGTNDLAWAGVSEDDVVRNTGTIIQMIKDKNPTVRIILLGILPRGEADIHQKCRNVNERTKGYADNRTVFFLNMEEQFGTGLGQVRPELYTGDQLHLSPAGYVKWAETMAPLFNEVLASAFSSKAVWMGDSITAGWGGSPIWNTVYSPIQTNNLAVSGHTTVDTLNLIENQNVLSGLNPKAVHLMIGTNDLWRGGNAAETLPNIERIVQHFKNNFAHARILLLGVLPSSVGQEFTTQAKLVNEGLARMANNDDVRFLNMWDQFADANDQLRPGLFTDGVHLTAQGYEVWHNTMNPTFNQLLEFN